MVLHFSLLKNYNIRPFLKGWGPKLVCQILTKKNDVRKAFQSMCGVLLLCFPLAKTPCTVFQAQRQCKNNILCTILHCVFEHLHAYKQSLDFNTRLLHTQFNFSVACLLAKARISEHVYTIRFKLKDSLGSSLKNNTMQVLSPCNWNPPKKHVSREILQQQVGHSEPAPTNAP